MCLGPRNDVNIKTVIFKKETIILHLQKKMFTEVLFFYFVVIIKNNCQKELNDNEKECETLDKGFFLR